LALPKSQNKKKKKPLHPAFMYLLFFYTTIKKKKRFFFATHTTAGPEAQQAAIDDDTDVNHFDAYTPEKLSDDTGSGVGDDDEPDERSSSITALSTTAPSTTAPPSDRNPAAPGRSPTRRKSRSGTMSKKPTRGGRKASLKRGASRGETLAPGNQGSGTPGLETRPGWARAGAAQPAAEEPGHHRDAVSGDAVPAEIMDALATGAFDVSAMLHNLDRLEDYFDEKAADTTELGESILIQDLLEEEEED
jgi:hypothetical protein